MRIRILYLLLILAGLSLVPASCEDSKPDKEVFGITIEPGTITIYFEDTYALEAILTGVDGEQPKVIWSSDNSYIEVSQEGVVTARNIYGPQTGTVYAEANGKQASCTVIAKYPYTYKYRLTLKDKGISDYSVDRPEEFLSEKAIRRRSLRNILIDDSDLPVSPQYISAVESTGCTVVAVSKWLKTITVACDGDEILPSLEALSFVSKVEEVYWGYIPVSQQNRERTPFRTRTIEHISHGAPVPENIVYDAGHYGSAWENIRQNNGHILHGMGYTGQGMDIAVIDGGFYNFPTNPSLDNVSVLGAKSFVYESPDPFTGHEHYHGIWVTSCMAANKPGSFVGTAPEANYWLLRSEDNSSEMPVEEDYWVTALEYADSVGVWLVNSSLGYKKFDTPYDDHIYSETDGHTMLPSIAAGIAYEKGIFVTISAMNDSGWVATPGESPGAFTVGALDKTGSAGYFSSNDITADGRMKPDAMALGEDAHIVDQTGHITVRSGTSYSSPIMCGLAACLWQAYPELTNKQLREVIIRSSDRYGNPVLPYGNGIPDMQKAMDIAAQIAGRNL